MYSNAAGIIPVVQDLLAKGAALGTVVVGAGILAVGYPFNALP